MKKLDLSHFTEDELKELQRNLDREMIKRSKAKHKYCRGCKNSKPLQEFYSNFRTGDGLSTRCKKCCSQASKEWKEKNADYVKVYKKAYREKKEDSLTYK